MSAGSNSVYVKAQIWRIIYKINARGIESFEVCMAIVIIIVDDLRINSSFVAACTYVPTQVYN